MRTEKKNEENPLQRKKDDSLPSAENFNNDVLPNEILNYMGLFFDRPTKGRAREVCRRWYNTMPPTLHLYLLGSPVHVGDLIWTNRSDPPIFRWDPISEIKVQDSFAKIPQDGFIVFSTYEEAHLYAHSFLTAQEDPNVRNGIYGSGYTQAPCIPTGPKHRRHYKPVVFEVVYTSPTLMDLKWHPVVLSFGEEDKKIRISCINTPNCKNNLEVISSKLELTFDYTQPIPRKTLYDSKPPIQQKEEIVSATEKESTNRRCCLI